MNKILLFPIFVMFMLALFGTTTLVIDNPAGAIEDLTGERHGEFVEVIEYGWAWFNTDTGSYYMVEGTGVDMGSSFNPSAVGNTEKSFALYNVDIKAYEYFEDYSDFLNGAPTETTTDLFDTNGLWILVGGLLAVGIVLGVKIFGSGLSEWSQYMIFVNGSYGAFWLFLTFGAYSLLLNGALGMFGGLLYTGLSFMFIVGVITETTGGGN